MKKTIILSVLLSCAGLLWAQNQNLYDAIRFSANELNGTARFVGVGGAMGALGGDATSMVYNPAGLGVYRSSELTISGNLHWTNTSMGGQSPVNDITANLANVAYIGTWLNPKEKGLISLNFGVGYTRLKAFNRRGNFHGDMSSSITDYFAELTNHGGPNRNGVPVLDFETENTPYLNQDIAWNSILAYRTYMIDPDPTLAKPFGWKSYYSQTGGNVINDLYFSEYGSTDEFSLSIAGNVANIFYWGMSFNCDYTYYSKSVNYYENFQDGVSMQHNNVYSMEGSAFVYKLGVIVKPLNWLRIGAAFHTPTWYNMHDWFSGSMSANNVKSTVETTPGGNGGTHITTPLKALGSLGFVLGKFGFIGIDYQYSNYLGMDIESRTVNIEDSPNAAIASTLQDTHTIRLGIEVKPIPALALRLGGGYTTPCTKSDAVRTVYYNDIRSDVDFFNDKGNYNVSAGVGYRISRHAIDLSYVWQVNEADYYSYIGAPAIGQRSVRNQFILTYGIRF